MGKGGRESPLKKRSKRLSQAWTVVTLAIKLFFFVMPQWPWWIVMVLRLMLFSLAVSPALASSVWYWLRRVRKNVAYGPGLRHTCDIYMPTNTSTDRKPLLIFLTGGAWIIGFRGWACPLGRALSAQGVIVVAPDYRNAPQARIDGMLNDCDLAIEWVIKHAESLGADKNKIFIAGQSAGAHLSALLLLRKAEEVIFNPDSASSMAWKPNALRGFIGISGPYHLEATAVHWIARGLNRQMFNFIFGNDMTKHSPTDECLRILTRLDESNDQEHTNGQWFSTSQKKSSSFGAALPPICLAHGTADQSAPSVTSELFEARLKLLGATVIPTVKYPEWSHTDPILEKPFAGNHTLHAHLFDQLHAWLDPAPSGLSNANNDGVHHHYEYQASRRKQQRPQFNFNSPDCARLAPSFLIAFGRWCMPF